MSDCLMSYYFFHFQNVLFYTISDDAEWVHTNLGNFTYYIGAEEPWEGQLPSEEDQVGKCLKKSESRGLLQ